MRQITVYMADDEWDRTHSMHTIAQTYFDCVPDPQDLLVEVVEHAGWWVLYGWDGDGIVSLGSANCRNNSPRAEGVHTRIRNCERLEYAGSIRRAGPELV